MLAIIFWIHFILMIYVKYILFACVATIINLLSQFIVFNSLNIFYKFEISLLTGTALGLLSKFILDKYFIFYAKQPVSSTKSLSMFALYSFTGIFTTLIFWFTEYLFYSLFDHHLSKYVGGLLGLAIGYTLKFILDKNLVFKKGTANA